MGKKRELVKAGSCKTLRSQVLGVNRKNIYHTPLQESKDMLLRSTITMVWKEHPSYGHRRLALELKANHKRVRRVMKKFNLKPPRRKSSYYTTRSTPHHSYANHIKGLTPHKPHELWCSDLSYIAFQGKNWYLATIEDICTREIVGACIGKYHNSKLVFKTIQHALLYTKQFPLIFHCDQGTEFMAKLCTDYLEKHGVRISVSDTASPWQNGYQESFFGRLKDEIGDIHRFETIGQLIEQVYAHIHYYNTKRIHTALKMPPTVYARQFS